MAKMYYTEEETLRKLNLTKEQLAALMQQGKLRAFPDGPRKVFRVDQVDPLSAPAAAASGDSGEIELTPADTGRDQVALSEADKPAPASKADTVLTSEGISIFDDEDLDIEAGDPMAKTAIAPSVEDQIQTEGVGSGSGLLDLTRESDDTSLGAEVLEHIDVESAPASAAEVEPTYAEPEAVGVVVEAPTMVEEIDSTVGLFNGLTVAACLGVLLMGVVVLTACMVPELRKLPPFLDGLWRNVGVVLAAAFVVSVICAIVGYVVGKSTAARAAALQR